MRGDLKDKKGERRKIADWDYSGLIAQDMMPLLGAPLLGQERIDYLKKLNSNASSGILSKETGL